MRCFSWWVSLTVSSLLVMHSASAKESPPQAAPVSPIEQSTLTPLTKEQRSLLIKAFKAYFGSDRAQSSTSTKLEVTSGVLSFQAVVNHQTLIESAQQYRSDIEFISSEGASRKYLVVSDGRIVWVYRPDAKKFAILPYQTLSKDPFSLLNMDLLSTVFLMRPPNVQAFMEDNEKTATTLKNMGIEFAGNERDPQGNTLAVYKTTAKSIPQAQAIYNFEARLFIDPIAGSIKKVQFSGEQRGFQLKISEVVLERTSPEQFAPKTFSFYPPVGTKRVPKLSVVPWGE